MNVRFVLLCCVELPSVEVLIFVMRGPSRSPSNFTFHLTCDLNLPISIRLGSLTGQLPSQSENFSPNGGYHPKMQSAVYGVAKLCDGGEVLGLEMHSRFQNTDEGGGCHFGEKLTFCVKYKDLPDSAQLAIMVSDVRHLMRVLDSGRKSHEY